MVIIEQWKSYVPRAEEERDDAGRMLEVDKGEGKGEERHSCLCFVGGADRTLTKMSGLELSQSVWFVPGRSSHYLHGHGLVTRILLSYPVHFCIHLLPDRISILHALSGFSRKPELASIPASILDLTIYFGQYGRQSIPPVHGSSPAYGNSKGDTAHDRRCAL